MKLNCLFEDNSIDTLINKINQYFGVEVRTIRSKMSIFEQYEVRPKKRTFVPEVWRYRIMARDGKYYFGKI